MTYINLIQQEICNHDFKQENDDSIYFLASVSVSGAQVDFDTLALHLQVFEYFLVRIRMMELWFKI